MKNLEIEKKKAKKEFLFLAIAIIVYEFLFQVVVLGVDFMEMTVLLLGFREIQWEQAADLVYNSGIALSIASVIGFLTVGLILQQMPSFQKKKKLL